MKIEALKNGMIVFDNDVQVSQMRPKGIKSIILFPPDPELRCAQSWRLQVYGEGWIVFTAETREELEKIRMQINDTLDSMVVAEDEDRDGDDGSRDSHE